MVNEPSNCEECIEILDGDCPRVLSLADEAKARRTRSCLRAPLECGGLGTTRLRMLHAP